MACVIINGKLYKGENITFKKGVMIIDGIETPVKRTEDISIRSQDNECQIDNEIDSHGDSHGDSYGDSYVK